MRPVPMPLLAVAFDHATNEAFLRKHEAAHIVRDGEQLRMIVDAELDFEPKRFYLAHMIGLWFVAFDNIGEGVSLDRKCIPAALDGRPHAGLSPEDRSNANTHACSWLVPKKNIRRLLAEGISNPAEIARRLQVSEAAMKIRLESLETASIQEDRNTKKKAAMACA